MNQVNATKRFCSIVTGVVLVLAALMLVAFVGVRLFGLTPYAVLSGSMEPEYPTGSLIYVRDVDPADVAVGDAITFELESGTLVTHEVYEIDSDARAFRTQGIANIDAGGGIVHDALPVPFERVIGAPVFCIPYLGYLNKFLTGTAGLLALGACALVLIALNLAVSLFEKEEDAPARGRHAASPPRRR